MTTSSAELTGKPKLDADGKNRLSAFVFARLVNVEIASPTDVVASMFLSLSLSLSFLFDAFFSPFFGPKFQKISVWGLGTRPF
tara:strand:- start:1643 stop:1891 length:249 start_codon:yes stop_codon:yes gene_type:complete